VFNIYDTVVVGGNLSGASAAISAAENGANVALIERRNEPHNPSHCGEFVTDITAEWLELQKIGCENNKINNLKIDINNKTHLFKLKNINLVVFDRNYLERYLLNKAKNHGAQVIQGNYVKDFEAPNTLILSNNERVEGKIIIDASGIACQIGKRIGINTKIKKEDIGVCIQSKVKSNFNSDMMQIWLHSPYAPFGYAWVFPKNNEIANIGLGIAGGQNLDLEKLLLDYIKYVTKDSYEIKNTFRACVPQAPPLKTILKDNVMIVGDAARLVDAPTGAGIQTAVFSGKLAGIIASKCIKNEIPNLEKYTHYMNFKIKKLKKAYKMKNKAYQNEEKLIRNYSKGISILNKAHKKFPNFSEKFITKRARKDIDIIDSLK
jgi:digeranylgeranylglycerophospholipid reductase